MVQESDYFGPLNKSLSPDTDLKKWFHGIGASSYFALWQIEKDLDNSRFSEKGKLECEGLFEALEQETDLARNFDISYPSHCAKLTHRQDEQKFIYQRQN